MSASAERVHANKADPTRTKTLRKTYARRLRAPLRKLVNAIKRGVRDRDVFGLASPSANRRHGRDERERLEVPTLRGPRGDRADAFMAWLDETLTRGLLAIVTSEHNPFVRQAYRRGLRHADVQLRQQGVDLDPSASTDPDAVASDPVHVDAIGTLETRNYEELRGIANEMQRQMMRALTDALGTDAEPSDVSAALVSAIHEYGIKRVTTLARTEIVHAHSEATITRYEQVSDRPDTDIQINAVTVKAEFVTAGDDRVCSTCAAIAGETVQIEGIREENFEWRGNQYPIQPPIHPRCRCALVPVTEINDDAPHRRQ